jgi:hypothetical protein
MMVALSACARIQPNTFEWKQILRQSKKAEAVQLHFREGLLDPETEAAASQQLAKSLPVPIIESTESAPDKKVLKILVDGTDKNLYDSSLRPVGTAVGTTGRRIGKSLAIGLPLAAVGATLYNKNGWDTVAAQVGLAAYGAGLGIVVIGVYYALFEGPIVAAADYADHKSFRDRFGYLPRRINGFATFKSDGIVFDDYMRNKYTPAPSRRFPLIDQASAMKEIGIGENRDEEILKISLETWMHALGADLAKHKIGRKAKPEAKD